MQFLTTVRSAVPSRHAHVVFEKTVQPPGDGSPEPAAPPPGAGGSGPLGFLPGGGSPTSALLLAIAGAIVICLLCMCLAAVVYWRLNGGRALAVNNPAPTAAVTPMSVSTPTPKATNTPSAVEATGTETSGGGPALPATPTPDVETQAQAFISQFSQAQEMQDVDFLMDHLGQATLDRYGEAQCRSYLETHAGTATDIQVQSLTYPEVFNYTTDGVTTTIPDSILVDITLQALGTPTTGSLHLLLEDGQVKWFTDCGTPLN